MGHLAQRLQYPVSLALEEGGRLLEDLCISLSLGDIVGEGRSVGVDLQDSYA